MTELMVTHAPRVRCYQCGHHAIFAVCHHCQRPMCDKHSPLAFLQGGILVRTPVGEAEEAKPVSRELAGFRLGGLKEAVYHCEDHVHIVRGLPKRWLIAGAGVAAFGLFLLLLGATGVGLVLLLAGTAVGAIRFLVYQQLNARSPRPPLPVVPHLGGIDLVEQLTGYVRLEGDRYTSVVDSIAGEMKVNMSVNDGHSALQTYRRKFKLPDSAPVSFSGGFLMFEGNTGLDFGRQPSPQVLHGGAGIFLGGDQAADYDLFLFDPEPRQRSCSIELAYEIAQDARPQQIPLWIVPSLVPAADRRALEVDLHWSGMGTDEERENPFQQKELSLSVFDLIELEVPASWGKLEGFAPDRAETGTAAGRRLIRWKHIKPDKRQDGSLTLRLRFERAITEVLEPEAGPPEHGARTTLTLSGRLEATFEGLLSGVTDVGVYLPGGGPAHYPRKKSLGPPTTTQTKVAVGFDISLRSIRYQDERVVPDENRAEDTTRPRADDFHGVVPDYATVAAVTKAVSEDNFYVRGVFEHLPYRDDGRPGVVNRVWDIAGRLYIDVFPIDFDINLRGDEIATANGFTGSTTAQITAKGAYALGTLIDAREQADAEDETPDLTEERDRQGDELLRRIEDTWNRLHARVTRVLDERANAAAAAPLAVTGPADTAYPREAAGPPGQRRPEDVVDAEAVEVPFPRAANGSAGRVEELRRERASTDHALIDGRIPEDIYRKILARIDAELAELGELL
jgi:hypothetical protein